MEKDNLDSLLAKINETDPDSREAVKDIFTEILKRLESDLLMLTSFLPKNKDFMQELGKSLALSSQWYLKVLGYKAIIQTWGDEWEGFIGSAFALYHTKFLDLYHTAEGIYEFLNEKEKGSSGSSEATNLSKSDLDALDEKLALYKKRYQTFTEGFASFYAELLAELATLKSAKTAKDSK